MSTITPEYALAEMIACEMSDDDRATYSREDWREGVSLMCDQGEHDETVLDILDELLGD